MKHVAIDLGSRESQVCVRTPDGMIVEEGKHATSKLIAMFASWEPRRVIVETSAEAFRIADAARNANHEVRVVPATLVRSLGVGRRGIKTDKRDAQVLSEVSCKVDLASVHIPTTTSRDWKSICGAREELVETRTKLICNVRGWLRMQLWRLRSGAPVSFHIRVREHALACGVELPAHVERNLRVIELVTEQIREANAHVGGLARTDATCKALMSIPGVGPITAVRFRAAIDDVSRFSSAHRLQSYLGLTPGENSSSERRQRTGITKAGAPATRRMLVQSAWAAFRKYRNEPMVQWAMRIADRRGKYIAIVALARKIAGIMFALWRDGTTYRSERSASS